VVLLVSVVVVALIAVASIAIMHGNTDVQKEQKTFDEAMANGNYEIAIQAGNKLAGAAKDRPDELAKYQYKLAQAWLEFSKIPKATTNEKFDREGKAVSCLKGALRSGKGNVEAEKLLCDIFWEWSEEGPNLHMGPQTFIEEATNLIAMSPNDAEAYYRRAERHVMLALRLHSAENANQAVADYRKAISLKKDSPEYWIHFAAFAGTDAAKLADSNPQTDKIFNDAAAANPNNAEILVSFAFWQMAHDNRAEAVDLIDKAIKNAPHDAKGYLARAQLRLMEQKLPEATADLEKAKQVDPTDGTAYEILARIYRFSSPPDLPKAAQCIRDGIDSLNKLATSQGSKENPDKLVGARLNLDNILADILLDMINRKKGGDKQLRDEVQSMLDQITQLRPQHPIRQRLAGRLALSDAMISLPQIDSAKLNDAIKLLEEADTLFNHTDRTTAGELMRAYDLDGKPGLVGKVIDNFLATTGNDHDVYFLLSKARLALSLRDYPKVLNCLDAVLKYDPSNAEAKNMRDTVNALSSTSTSGDLKIGNVPITNENVRLFQDRAENAWNMGNHDGAIELLKELHRKLPDNLNVSLELVNGYANNKQDGEARKILDTLIADSKDAKVKQELQSFREQLSTPDPKQRQIMAYKKAMDLADAQEGNDLKKALTKAAIAMQYNQKDEYLKYLDQAAKIAPTDKVVISRKFELALSANKIADAQKWADAAVENNTDGVKGKEFKARLAAARNDMPEAIHLLEQADKEQPDSPKTQLMLANAYRASGIADKAEAIYKAIYASNPGNPEVLRGLIMVSLRPDKRDDYIKYVKAAYALAPGDPFFAEMNQEIQEGSMKPEDSIPIREGMLTRNPNDLNSIYRLASLYEYTNQLSKAEEMCVRAVQIASDKVGAARNLGQFYLRNKRFNDVRKLMDKLLTEKVDPVAIHGMYGEFLMTQDIEQARGEFQKAIDANPQDSRGYFYMARFAESQQQWPVAVAHMMKVLDLDPTARGQAAEKELVKDQIYAGQSDPRQLDNAQARIGTLLARRPGDPEALYYKAMWAMMKDPPSLNVAEEALTTAVTSNSDDRVPLLNRANYYIGQGEFPKARADLEAAQKIAPSDLEISLGLAKVMLMQYEVDKAILQLKDILHSNPDYGPAVNELVGIYLRKQMWGELDSLLSPILQKNKNPAPLYVIKYQELLAQGKVKEALGALDKARNLAPESQDILRTYFQAMIDQKMYSDVIEQIGKFQAAKPTQYDWLNVLLMNALVGVGRTADADKILESKYASFKGQLFDFLMEQAIRAYTPKDLLDRLVRWSKARPGDIKALYYRGNIAIEAEDFVVADQTFDEAIALSKSPQEALQYRRLKAAAYYQRHVVHRPETQYRDMAEKLFTEVIQESKSRDVQALNNLAYMYVDDLNDPDKALPLAEQAAKLQPDSKVLDTYGWVLARKAAGESDGQKKNMLFDKARQQLERSVELQPGIENRYHLGWVYEQTGKAQDGLKLYRQVFELLRNKKQAPLYEPVKTAIDRLSH
jgi:predicted Zn-dependent protease